MKMVKELCFTVNGEKYRFGEDENECIPETETLRETLQKRIPGIDLKRGCNRGICGNCSVLENDKVVNACMILTASCQEKRILTWEGLRESELRLYDMFKKNAYFLQHAAYISIRGLVMICIAQFHEKGNPTDQDFVEALRNNYGNCLDAGVILDLLHCYRDLDNM